MEPHELDRERRRLARDLPPLYRVLRGSLFERFRRCGKASCHCADPDDAGHPVVCVSRSLPGGRTSQVSLPRALVPLAEEWTENGRLWLRAIEEISAINHELLRRRWVEPPDGKGSRRR